MPKGWLIVTACPEAKQPAIEKEAEEGAAATGMAAASGEDVYTFAAFAAVAAAAYLILRFGPIRKKQERLRSRKAVRWVYNRKERKYIKKYTYVPAKAKKQKPGKRR